VLAVEAVVRGGALVVQLHACADAIRLAAFLKQCLTTSARRRTSNRSPPSCTCTLGTGTSGTPCLSPSSSTTLSRLPTQSIRIPLPTIILNLTLARLCIQVHVSLHSVGALSRLRIADVLRALLSLRVKT
jgi:hypothetical protein